MNSEMNKLASSASVKVDNHIELSSAVNSIQNIYDDANELLARITGNDTNQPEPSNAKEIPPCLADALSGSPQKIRMSCEEIHKLLTQIREALF